MVTPEMIGYIKSQQRAAVTEEEIRQKLKQNGGWTDADLDEAFSMIRLEAKAPPAPALVETPAATSAAAQPAPAPAVKVSASPVSSAADTPSVAPAASSAVRSDIVPLGSVSAPAVAPRVQPAMNPAPAPVLRKKSRGILVPLIILILLLGGGAAYLYMNDWMLFGAPVMDLLPFGVEEPAPVMMEEESLEPVSEMAAEEPAPPFLTETKDLVQISKDIAKSQMQGLESGVPTTE